MRPIPATIVLLIVFTVGCSKSTDSGPTQRITSEREHPFLVPLPHVAPIDVLIVDGRRFENVRGIRTFYLPIPSMDAIMFVTQGDTYHCTYHVYRMDTREDVSIPMTHSLFGYAIGSTHTNLRKDSVEVNSSNILLCTLFNEEDGKQRRRCDTIDLSKRAVVAEKTVIYDKEGKVIHEHEEPPPF